MSTHEPEDSDGDWVKRYRQASDTDAAMPSAATREAILAEGRRVAASRAANPTMHRFDPKQPAANQSRWKLAAAGTVGAALFAAVLMFPHLGSPPSPSTAKIVSTPAVSAPPSTPPASTESASDALENVVVTGARRASPPPSRMLARKAQPTPAPEAAELDRNANSTLHEAQDATSDTLAGAQIARLAPAAPAAASSAPAAPGAMTSAAVRGNLMSDNLLTGVASGDLARVSALLDAGANPELADSMGRTPLLRAVIAQREDMVQLLLAHHADPNAPDHSGQTPLQRARLDGQLNMVSLLKRAGAR
jgi:ankyrin repeat protein